MFRAIKVEPAGHVMRHGDSAENRQLYRLKVQQGLKLGIIRRLMPHKPEEVSRTLQTEMT